MSARPPTSPCSTLTTALTLISAIQSPTTTPHHDLIPLRARQTCRASSRRALRRILPPHPPAAPPPPPAQHPPPRVIRMYAGALSRLHIRSFTRNGPEYAQLSPISEPRARSPSHHPTTSQHLTTSRTCSKRVRILSRALRTSGHAHGHRTRELVSLLGFALTSAPTALPRPPPKGRPPTRSQYVWGHSLISVQLRREALQQTRFHS